MSLEAIGTRLSAECHAALSAQAEKHHTSIGKILSNLLEKADVTTINRALCNRFDSAEEPAQVTKRSSFLVKPEAVQRLNTLALRTGLPIDLTLRLIVEESSM